MLFPPPAATATIMGGGRAAASFAAEFTTHIETLARAVESINTALVER